MTVKKNEVEALAASDLPVPTADAGQVILHHPTLPDVYQIVATGDASDWTDQGWVRSK